MSLRPAPTSDLDRVRPTLRSSQVAPPLESPRAGSGGSGIGFFVWDSYNASNLARVIAAVILIGGVGVVLDMAFLRLGKAVAYPEVAS